MLKKILISFLLIVSYLLNAQVDSIQQRKNIIKYNVTAPLLWGSKNFIVNYERLISDKSSINLSIGFRSFPKLIGVGKTDSAFLVREHENKGGINIYVDFRRYILSENKYAAPHGLYFSPYINYLHNSIENRIGTYYSDLAEVLITTDINIISAGIELGYQFIFWNRLVVDFCFLGPSLSHYSVKLTLDGNSNLEDFELLQKYEDILRERYPITNLLLSDFHLEKTGVISKFSFGYRYYIKLGFLF